MTRMTPPEIGRPAGGTAPAPQGARVHELKADPAPFAAVLSGEKAVEVRVNDRDFRVGDVLRLREFDRTAQRLEWPADGVPSAVLVGYTGRECERVVTHVQTGYGLPDGLVVLSLAQPPRPAAVAEGDADVRDNLLAIVGLLSNAADLLSEVGGSANDQNDVLRSASWLARYVTTLDAQARTVDHA